MLWQSLIGAVLLAAAPAPATQIPAAMTSTVTSKTAKVGDIFTFKTTQDVLARDGAIPAGTAGEGIVTAVSAAAGTHRGTLSLEPQYLTLANGKRLRVTAASPTAYAAHRHLFPFPMPFPGVFVIGGVQNPGADVTIGPGTTFQIAIPQSISK